MYDLVLKNGTLVLPGEALVGDLAVQGGRVAALGRGLEGASAETLDVSGLVVLPGAIDPHVHMELPVGGTRSCDDFLEGSRAAASGGVTTIIDFTVGSRETAMTEDLDARLVAASKSVIDYAFHAAAMDPVRDGLLADLATLAPVAGAIPMVSSVTGAVLRE